MNPMMMQGPAAMMPMGQGQMPMAGGAPAPGMTPQQMYPEMMPVDPTAMLQQIPGLTPEMLLQMLQSAGDPMQLAQQGRGQPTAPPNPLLQALMATGGMPPQMTTPAGTY